MTFKDLTAQAEAAMKPKPAGTAKTSATAKATEARAEATTPKPGAP